jgi:hypothetical protein
MRGDRALRARPDHRRQTDGARPALPGHRLRHRDEGAQRDAAARRRRGHAVPRRRGALPPRPARGDQTSAGHRLHRPRIRADLRRLDRLPEPPRRGGLGQSQSGQRRLAHRLARRRPAEQPLRHLPEPDHRLLAAVHDQRRDRGDLGDAAVRDPGRRAADADDREPIPVLGLDPRHRHLPRHHRGLHRRRDSGVRDERPVLRQRVPARSCASRWWPGGAGCSSPATRSSHSACSSCSSPRPACSPSDPRSPATPRTLWADKPRPESRSISAPAR